MPKVRLDFGTGPKDWAEVSSTGEFARKLKEEHPSTLGVEAIGLPLGEQMYLLENLPPDLLDRTQTFRPFSDR